MYAIIKSFDEREKNFVLAENKTLAEIEQLGDIVEYEFVDGETVKLQAETVEEFIDLSKKIAKDMDEKDKALNRDWKARQESFEMAVYRAFRIDELEEIKKVDFIANNQRFILELYCYGSNNYKLTTTYYDEISSINGEYVTLGEYSSENKQELLVRMDTIQAKIGDMFALFHNDY